MSGIECYLLFWNLCFISIECLSKFSPSPIMFSTRFMTSCCYTCVYSYVNLYIMYFRLWTIRSITMKCSLIYNYCDCTCRSMKMCQLLYRYPILLDAATAAIIRKGDKFFARWADIMTGRMPKIHLLHPEIVIVVAFEMILLLIKGMFGKRSKKRD